MFFKHLTSFHHLRVLLVPFLKCAQDAYTLFFKESAYLFIYFIFYITIYFCSWALFCKKFRIK